MSELNTIQVEKNREREREAARRRAAKEQQRQEAIRKRKQQQMIKYVSSFALIITAIILCCAYLFGVFDPKDEKQQDDSNPETNIVVNNTSDNNESSSSTEETTPNYVEVVGFNADDYVFLDSMYKFETEEKILDMLENAANTASDAQEEYQFLLKNKAAYPQGLLYLAVNEPLALEFVIEYPFESKDATYYYDLSEEMSQQKVPHLLQWDKRWGYSAYGDENMALDGCGPTCLSMVLIGLTGKEIYNPMYVANYCEERGYYLDGVGTKWDFFTEGAEFFNLTSMQIGNDEARMISELEKGNILICSMAPGDFTMSGHFIVIWDYKDGEFVVNDPNSIVRSEKTWSYEVLKSQFKAIWTFSLSE